MHLLFTLKAATINWIVLVFSTTKVLVFSKFGSPPCCDACRREAYFMGNCPQEVVHCLTGCSLGPSTVDLPGHHLDLSGYHLYAVPVCTLPPQRCLIWARSMQPSGARCGRPGRGAARWRAIFGATLARRPAAVDPEGPCVRPSPRSWQRPAVIPHRARASQPRQPAAAQPPRHGLTPK